MKTKLRYLSGLALILLMLFTVVPVQAAAPKINVPKNFTVTLYNAKDCHLTKKQTSNSSQRIAAIPVKITNLKSSMPSVLSVTKSTSSFGKGYWTNIYGTAKKAGTTTVSFKANSKTYKIKVTVKKYVNPVSSIKIGTTSISKTKFNSSANYTLKYSNYAGKKLRVNFKLASGWKFYWGDLVPITYGNGSTWKSYQNNKTITFNRGKNSVINVTAVNISTGQIEQIDIFFK